ncbi:hypothetical protein CAPTEDRAFT_186439 [Capitella teleta]|uniref:Tyrosine-protein kinase n=1 Tax=Capitella teleta TaxID=283909 RepID=R7VKY6_CAPTE|nr:hypothetical protein CAPTEDRAFT_186439 [Capitella teleta]|eukprot:ELU17160.1 hypothetical protein CAPTEDRAFT_186439 [Capitella teleta]
MLLSILPSKGPDAFGVFVEALSKKQPHLHKLLMEQDAESCVVSAETSALEFSLSVSARDKEEDSEVTHGHIKRLDDGGLYISPNVRFSKIPKLIEHYSKHKNTEAQVMKSLTHKNIVQLLAACTEEEPILIVTEYLANGSLLAYLRQRHDDTLPLHTLLDIAAKVADGMAYIEDRNLIHQDLAARKIFLAGGPHA